MPDPDIFDEFTNRELETMDIMLLSDIAGSVVTIEEYIRVALAQGVSREAIRTFLLNDLETGGRIFGQFRNAIKATANGTTNRMRDGALYSEFGVVEQYRWVAVLANTCPDCLDRHGVVKSWEEWEGEGLPRAGMTVCKDHCNCVLLPSNTTELEPIKRGKK